MDPDEVIAKALEVGKGIFTFLHGLITSIVEFFIEHPEVLVFAFGFFIGYKVGMFFGKEVPHPPDRAAHTHPSGHALSGL